MPFAEFSKLLLHLFLQMKFTIICQGQKILLFFTSSNRCDLLVSQRIAEYKQGEKNEVGGGLSEAAE